MYVLLIDVCPFVLFRLVIVLSVLLRYTDTDYSFGIFKLFLQRTIVGNVFGQCHAPCTVKISFVEKKTCGHNTENLTGDHSG